MAVLGVVFVVAAVPLLAFVLVRQDLYGGWSDSYGQHKCGHLQRYGHSFGGGVCGKCGEKGGWKQVTARARFPFGWEIKK